MNNIEEYLKWRGEITFRQVPYNEVDAYILSKIGVPDFSGIIPSDGKGMLLKDAYDRYFGRKDINPDYFGRLNQPILSKTLRQLPQTGRFGKLILSDYIQKYNKTETEQISALTVSLPGGPCVITFRGTDDTIVGWKENFLMAVCDAVPAQKDAVEYLKIIAERHSGPLVIMGHSKGGNLAVYSAVMAPESIQKRISRVYNFDGPGFQKEFFTQPGMEIMQDRILNYVSQHTIVGTLLTQSDNLTICRSKRAGPFAHEAMFWEVMGPSFIREKKVSALSAKIDRLLNKQMEQMTAEERARFIEDFFGILTSSGANTLTELTRLPPDQMRRLIKKINTTESVKGFGKELMRLIFQDKGKLTSTLKRILSNRREDELKS